MSVIQRVSINGNDLYLAGRVFLMGDALCFFFLRFRLIYLMISMN
jgi:hypothetical protein